MKKHYDENSIMSDFYSYKNQKSIADDIGEFNRMKKSSLNNRKSIFDKDSEYSKLKENILEEIPQSEKQNKRKKPPQFYRVLAVYLNKYGSDTALLAVILVEFQLYFKKKKC